MNPSSKPASLAEISTALAVLFESGLPFQRGVNPDRIAAVYADTLRGCSLDAVEAGICKFLRGECDGVSPRFVPTPPELSKIVRTAVVPRRIPAERRIAPYREPLPGERDRMRLKMPMWQAAHGNAARLDALARANAEGFEAMVVLAATWGVSVPQELLDMPGEEAARQWRQARKNAWANIERSPPKFWQRYREKFPEAAE